MVEPRISYRSVIPWFPSGKSSASATARIPVFNSSWSYITFQIDAYCTRSYLKIDSIEDVNGKVIQHLPLHNASYSGWHGGVSNGIGRFTASFALELVIDKLPFKGTSYIDGEIVWPNALILTSPEKLA
ncbi:MAG: hypothetical protein SPK00_05820 [Corynebacterium glucuronolyticum]|nr:hypothetical protein [Corynebacterium glucuronolyticum]